MCPLEALKRGRKEKEGESSGFTEDQAKCVEKDLEQTVSKTLGAMKLLWVPIKDGPGPQSLRRCIERNSMALLSGYRDEETTPASTSWLGRFCDREKIRRPSSSLRAAHCRYNRLSIFNSKQLLR